MEALGPGAVMFLGVVGVACVVPSLVVGLLPFDKAEPGLGGGSMEPSASKKLDVLYKTVIP